MRREDESLTRLVIGKAVAPSAHSVSVFLICGLALSYFMCTQISTRVALFTVLIFHSHRKAFLMMESIYEILCVQEDAKVQRSSQIQARS